MGAGAAAKLGAIATGLVTAVEAVFDPVFAGERFAVFRGTDFVRLAFVLTAAVFVALAFVSFGLAAFRFNGFPFASGRPSFLAFRASRYFRILLFATFL